jgi:magnesium chelatase family protein
VQRYRQRLSGPLLDRIDIRIHVPRVDATELIAPDLEPGKALQLASATENDPRVQVQAARARREARSGAISARLPIRELQRCCTLPAASKQLLRRSCEQLGLSGRGVHRLLALSRTIADLALSDSIEPEHLAEAIQLRRPLPDG